MTFYLTPLTQHRDVGIEDYGRGAERPISLSPPGFWQGLKQNILIQSALDYYSTSGFFDLPTALQKSALAPPPICTGRDLALNFSDLNCTRCVHQLVLLIDMYTVYISNL